MVFSHTKKKHCGLIFMAFLTESLRIFELLSAFVGHWLWMYKCRTNPPDAGHLGPMMVKMWAIHVIFHTPVPYHTDSINGWIVILKHLINIWMQEQNGSSQSLDALGMLPCLAMRLELLIHAGWIFHGKLLHNLQPKPNPWWICSAMINEISTFTQTLPSIHLK